MRLPRSMVIGLAMTIILMKRELFKQFLIFAIIIGVIVVATLRIDKFLNLRDKELMLKAIDDCATRSMRTFGSEDGQTTEVDRWFYKFCLKDKGYQSIIQ